MGIYFLLHASSTKNTKQETWVSCKSQQEVLFQAFLSILKIELSMIQLSQYGEEAAQEENHTCQGAILSITARSLCQC